jgi:hypothetical protein
MSGHVQITPNAPDWRTYLLMIAMFIIMLVALSSCKTYYVNDYTSSNENSYTIIKSLDKDSLNKYGFIKSKKMLR